MWLVMQRPLWASSHSRQSPRDPVQVDDLIGFSKDVRLQYSSRLPIFVGGQSMGALAALHAVLRDQSAWDGIILGTATIDVKWTWFLRCAWWPLPYCLHPLPLVT
jgi:alpha-beta hydrolase superfamily lysophospholipase